MLVPHRADPGPPTSSAPPPRPTEAATETHEGKNNGAVSLNWPSEVAGFLTFDCPKCSSNVVVTTDGDDSLLINAIGSYHGTVWFNMDRGAKPTHTLHISANASWTATVADHRTLPTVEPGKPHTSHGDAVLAIPTGVTRATFSTKSDGHAAVWVLTDRRRDLAVNQIGAYDGEFEVPGPTYVAVEAYESDWTFTAR
ncbi:hypothetical protein [Amycolatopsis jejuensis]|uniref:hypothetical protein n=1 Tax=Amycolatopsis jejuensis TaxID=330084 RepID=UPI001FE081C7|nr:hypothetical protein [Amycolatopsis jejuensis]